MKTCIPLESPLALQPDLTGGKGCNLARLLQAGFHVPAGFVVSAHAYRQFAASIPWLNPTLESLPIQSPSELATACADLQSRLRQTPLPAELAEAILAELVQHPADVAWSVRSSSTLEDLAGAAFAGQHDTFLNLSHPDAVLQRVRDCFVSLWSDRAVAYRVSRGFAPAACDMAVVIQRLVDAEASGVGFTLNPINGRLDELVINANAGLGESVVSGEADVDQWILDKASLAPKSESIGTKSLRVVRDSSGTIEQRVAGPDADQPSLTAAQLTELAALLVSVERHFGFPQDVEWAFAHGQLHLLQSRPVTTVPPRWTRDESAERFPEAIAPLTWDFVEAGFHESLRHSFALLGFPKFDGRWFGLHGHYVYGNQNAVDLYARRSPIAPRNLDELRAALPVIRERFAWVRELPLRWHRDLDEHLLAIGRFSAEPLQGLSLREVWERVLAINAHGTRYFLPNIAISIAHGALHRTLRAALSLALPQPEAQATFDDLLAWCETRTAAVNGELHQLASLARQDPTLVEQMHSLNAREFLDSDTLDQFPRFASTFREFLQRHGHREVEFDAYIPTWIETPWVIVDHVRALIDSTVPARESHERELRVRSHQAEQQLLSRIPADLGFFFAELIRLARTYTALDDEEHYQTTRLTPPLRRALREFGSRLVALDVVTDPMDVFFARHAQVEAALAANSTAAWLDLARSIASQKAAYLADRQRSPDWELNPSTPQPLASNPASGELRGLAGSPGTAEGPVFIVRATDDFARFPRNAILVARTTNPGWTPLFYSAAALITESGGPLSHGAVTAREVRIPAVMAVKGCLQILQDGDRVRVDGEHGIITRLDSAP